MCSIMHTAMLCTAQSTLCAGVYINISPLDVGWAKLVEVVRYVKAFRQSGKFCWSYMELGGEKE